MSYVTHTQILSLSLSLSLCLLRRCEHASLTFGGVCACRQIDAIGTKRFDSDKSGDREVQRTMLELLNQLDGFSTETTIKVTLPLPLRL